MHLNSTLLFFFIFFTLEALNCEVAPADVLKPQSKTTLHSIYLCIWVWVYVVCVREREVDTQDLHVCYVLLDYVRFFLK